ncbi:hypothetical protein BBP40_004143 [Aspergillus hancockii]|nr:hypothetical protein BBP40_004143 [Aspergillus hancockii]
MPPAVYGSEQKWLAYREAPAVAPVFSGGSKSSSSSSDLQFRSAKQKQLLSLHRPQSDQSFAPNLTATALDVQLKEVFSDVVDAVFPNLYAAFSARVDLTWVDFVRHHSAAQSAAVNWGIRSLNTWFLARRHQDHDKLQASRHMYNRALRNLVHSLHDPKTVKSDATLAAAMALGVYEMLDGVGPNSWLVHSRGIGALFKLRGADAHRSGFGRTMYTTYRAFLVAEAFVCQEACFLEGKEWRTMNKETLMTEEREGKGSRLGEITENAFGEALLCPGYLVRTREVITGKGTEASRDSLVDEIQRSKDTLQDLQRRLASLLELSMNGRPVQTKTAVISEKFVHKISQSTLQGMDSALALLDQLLVLLAANKIRLLGAGDCLPDAASPWNAVAVRQVPEPLAQEAMPEGTSESQSSATCMVTSTEITLVFSYPSEPAQSGQFSSIVLFHETFLYTRRLLSLVPATPECETTRGFMPTMVQAHKIDTV